MMKHCINKKFRLRKDGHRFKIQQRFLFFFWVDVKGLLGSVISFDNQAEAERWIRFASI